MFNRNVGIEILCPVCKYPNKLTIAELEANPTFCCDGCKRTVTVDASDVTEGLAHVEEMLKKIPARLK